MLIGCLHTAATNIAALDAAAAGMADVVLRHVVRPDLLAAALAAGEMTAQTRAEAEAALRALAEDCDAVLLTCSSIGRAVEGVQGQAVPILRVDAALAERAVRDGGKVVVLYAAPSSAAPTTQLFAEAAGRTGASLEVCLVPEAWAQFSAGEQVRYFALVAAAAEAAYRDGADVVALAQVSMAGAATLVRGGPEPLSGPSIGLQAVIERLGERNGVLA
ncbi:MAG TPA: Asp/Glu racemase [Devosia sp.]|nr:Asp/Glu racemase [Devosia sp.]